MANILKTLGGSLFKGLRVQTIRQTQIYKKRYSTNLATQEEKPIEEKQDSIDPLAVEDYFEVGKLFTVTDLFDARVHYGHKVGSLNDYMRPYIFGERLEHLIIDLDKTAPLLRQALNFTAHIAYRDGLILFVSQTPQHTLLIESTAKECGEYAHARRWGLGMFTNSSRYYGIITRPPDLCIVLNTLSTVLSQHLVIPESAKMGIPVVGIVDTNCDPRLVTYPVPGNDDSPASMELYCRLFKAAILKGKQMRNENNLKT